MHVKALLNGARTRSAKRITRVNRVKRSITVIMYVRRVFGERAENLACAVLSTGATILNQVIRIELRF